MSAKIRQELRKLASLRPSNPEVFNELVGYATGVVQGTEDRALAMVGAAHLEDALREAITKHLPPSRTPEGDQQLFVDENAPLAGLAARTRMAFSLGIITDQQKTDITTIRGIRNALAHAPDHLTFKTDTIRAAINSLNVLKNVLDKDSQLEAIAGNFFDAVKFAVSVSIICGSVSKYHRPFWERPNTLAELLMQGAPEAASPDKPTLPRPPDRNNPSDKT